MIRRIIHGFVHRSHFGKHTVVVVAGPLLSPRLASATRAWIILGVGTMAEPERRGLPSLVHDLANYNLERDHVPCFPTEVEDDSN